VAIALGVSWIHVQLPGPIFAKYFTHLYFISSIVMTFLVRECYGSPKISIKFVKIHQNSLKFKAEECYDKVLNEEF
jgi:hypothetical protein